MRNLGYTCVYIILIYMVTVVGTFGQADCNILPTPANDLCGNAIVLLNNHLGNTCCASIETEDYCGSMESGVWYRYTQFSAHRLSVSNVSISGPIGVEVYSGSCGNLVLEERSDCSGFDSREFILKECINEFYIHITSMGKGCGAFNINVTTVNNCPFAETCSDISGAQTLNPLSDDIQECISSCLQYACGSSCADNGIWFRMNTDAIASTIQLAVKNANFNPVIRIQSGTSCGNKVDVVPCRNLTVNEFITLDVNPSSSYFIEVSQSGGIPGPFDLCINSIQDFMDCSNGSLTPMRPMFPLSDPYGPYCPGETVTFCYDLEFHVDIPGMGNECQWLQGLIPVLGGGWNTSVNALSNQPPAGWQWLDEGNVDYNDFSNILSIGTDQNGTMIMQYGGGGLSQNELLPGGWWYTSPGSEADCINDGDPDNMYGLEIPCGETLNFTHCFDLTTKNVNQISGCSDNFGKDLSVKIFNLTDGETGCYNDFTCAGDTPITFDGKIDCISDMDIFADNKEICSGEFADISVAFVEDATYMLEIVVLDAGNTSGAQNWIFERGKGRIPDEIINLGDQIEVVSYEARVYNALSSCPSPIERFELRVLPEIVFNGPTSFTYCEGQSTQYIAPPGFASYKWFNSNNTLLSSVANFVFPSEGDYVLRVSNGSCDKNIDISVTSVSPLSEALNADSAEVCNFNNGSIPTFLDLTSYQLNGIDGQWYDADDNLIPDPGSVDFDGVTEQTVLYRFESSSDPAPCAPSNFNFEITIIACLCPSTELAQPDNFCALAQNIELDGYKITTENGLWSLLSGPDINSMDIAGSTLNIYESTVPGEYSLSFMLANAASIGACPATETVQFSIIEPVSLSLQNQVTACNASGAADPNIIDLDDLVLNGISGSWSSSTGLNIEQGNIVRFDGQSEGDYTFTFTSSSAEAPCPDTSEDISVRVINCICPPLEIESPGNFCKSDFSFQLSDIIIDAGSGTWSVSGPNHPNMPYINNNVTLEISATTPAANYMLTYTLDDPNIPSHCADSVTLPFSVTAAPSAIIPKEVITCNGGNGTEPQILNLTPLVTGGSGGGIWSTMSTEFQIINNQINFAGVTPGFYQIFYTTNDAVAPCPEATVSMTVEVEDCRCPQVNFTQFPDLCVGQDTFDLNDYIDTNADGEWYINGIVGTNAIAIINRHFLRYSTFAAPGLYTLSYRLYNFGYPADCDLVFYMDFYIHPIPKATIRPSARVCNFDAGIGPDQIDLDTMYVSGSPGDWSSPHPEITIQANNIVSFDGLAAGTYKFIYTTNDAKTPCVNKTYEMNVIVDDCTCPELSVVDLGPLCQTDPRIYLYDYLENSTGWFGTWTVTDPTGMSINVEQLDPEDMDPGEYELMFTWAQKPHGTCQDFAVNTLTINAPPEADVISAVSVCNILNAQAPACIDLTSMVMGDPGAWSAPANFTGDFSDLSNICFEGLPAGETYAFSYITSSAQAPCSEAEGITVITVEDCSCPILNIIEPDPVCNFGGSLDLKSLETSNIADGYWEVVGGPQTVTLSGTLMDASDLLPGVYTLQFSPTDPPASHCKPNSQVDLTIIESRNAGQGQEIEYCFEQMDFLDINQLLTDADPGGTWREITIDNIPSMAFDVNTGILTGSNLAPGKYDFQYYQDNEQPCEDKFTVVSIIINQLPQADAGEPVQLNCAMTESMIGGNTTSSGPDYQYTWYSMEGYSLAANNVPEILVSDPGMYVLEVMNMSTGCMEQDSVEVYMIDDQPYFDVDVISSPCDFEQLGTILAINPTGGDGFYEYSIDNGANWTTNNAFADLGNGEYTVLVQDGRGCSNEVSGVVVVQAEPIGLYAGEDMVLDYSDELITIDISIQTDLSNIDSVIWIVDGELLCEGSVADCYAIEVNPGEINTYCVTLIDVHGCSETDCITLEEELNVDVYIPNIFSMNDITINNRMFVQSGPYVDKVLEFKVYDRWGSLLFDGEPDHSPNEPGFGWDGRFNYENVEPGVYVYVIRVSDVLGRDYQFQGDITLIK